MSDEPELVCKEDKQEGKPKVNQNEHNLERLNAGDNQKEIVVMIQQKRLEIISAIENEGETESDFSRSRLQLPLKTCGMYVTFTLSSPVNIILIQMKQ